MNKYHISENNMLNVFLSQAFYLGSWYSPGPGTGFLFSYWNLLS